MDRVFILDAIDGLTEYFLNTPKELEPEKVGMIGTEYVQMGWPKVPLFREKPKYAKHEFTNYSYGDCCVWWFPMKYLEKGIKYDNLPLKCDRDFTAQVFASGLWCRKMNWWQMDSPLNGKAPGGCQQWYQMDMQEHNEVLALLKKWNGTDWWFPNEYEINPKTGRFVFKTEEDEKAYLKEEKASNLANFRPKKTSYNRCSDIKFWWQRIFLAATVPGKIKGHENFVKPDSIYEFDDSINNFKPASALD